MSKTDAASLNALVEGLADPTSCDEPSSRTVDNSEGGFMALHVERIGTQMYSLAHYFRQNGDMMRDPDVVLFKDAHGRWFPATFQQARRKVTGSCAEVPEARAATKRAASALNGPR